MRLPLLGLVLAAGLKLFAEGTDPKLKPEGYGVHAKAGDFVLGASYYSRSFTSQGRSYFLSRHLVVEVGVYGPLLKKTPLSPGQFALYVNTSEHGILPVSGALAAYDTKWGDDGRGLMVQAGPVVLGGPNPESRFPGDKREVPLPRVPDQQPGREKSQEENDLPKLLADAALPTGERVLLPVSGYLYFPFEKKAKSAKSLYLVWQGPAGELRVKLK